MKPGQRVYFDVEQGDIDFGVPCHPGRCALSRAIDRVLDTATSIVGNGLVTWRDIATNTPHVAKLSKAAVKFYDNFDNDDDVQPQRFSFTVIQ